MPNDLTARLVEALKEAGKRIGQGNDATREDLRKQMALLDRIDALLAEAAQASAKPEAVGIGPFKDADGLIEALHAAPPAAPEGMRDMIGRGASIVRRLYNETPNVADAVAAGEWIQQASQLLAAAPTPGE